METDRVILFTSECSHTPNRHYDYNILLIFSMRASGTGFLPFFNFVVSKVIAAIARKTLDIFD